MAVAVEEPKSEDELADFVAFADTAHASRSAHWPALPLQLPLLRGEGPSAVDRKVRPLVAREDGRIVAKAAAVVDGRYIAKWGEPLGHVIAFDALPGTRTATQALMDEACTWLRSEGMEAARTGFGPGFDMAYAIDDYESLPPSIVRQNPAYYHSLLKEARFETERGWVDYKIAVTPELVARWEHMLEGARRSGFEIRSLSEVPEADRVEQFTETWEEAFDEHWGMSPSSVGEFAEVFETAGPMGMLDASMMAFGGGEPVGAVWALPQLADLAVLAPGRALRPDERLNFLGIGVRRSARGRGVNLAMAAKCYLGLVAGGATHVSYTMVLDDNWPSRRTAEKLGADVCASYLVYRRSLRAVP